MNFYIVLGLKILMILACIPHIILTIALIGETIWGLKYQGRIHNKLEKLMVLLSYSITIPALLYIMEL